MIIAEYSDSLGVLADQSASSRSEWNEWSFFISYISSTCTYDTFTASTLNYERALRAEPPSGGQGKQSSRRCSLNLIWRPLYRLHTHTHTRTCTQRTQQYIYIVLSSVLVEIPLCSKITFLMFVKCMANMIVFISTNIATLVTLFFYTSLMSGPYFVCVIHQCQNTKRD